jgi:hypothetical protein
VAGSGISTALQAVPKGHGSADIDRASAQADEVRPGGRPFPEADRGFFQALVEEDADQLEAWLEKYPMERLSQEAAQLLVGYRIDEDGEPEQFEKAVHWLRGTWREDLVSTRTLDLMRDLRAAGYPMRAVFAGELGIEGGRKDRYPNAVHQLHASIGEILLDHDEDKRAWRHLLSAAFGLPGDGLINLKLGQFYEKQERYHRAMSRYVQAVVTVDAGEKALEGLDRVQRKMGDAQPISVDTIGPLMAGKTSNWNSPAPSKGIKSLRPLRLQTGLPGMPPGNRPRCRSFWPSVAFFTPARARSSSSGWWPVRR